MANAIKSSDVMFLDTSYAMALSIKTDQFHAKATQLADRLASLQSRFVTTRAILLEIGNALARLRYRSAGIRLLNGFERDPNVEIIPLSEDLYTQALDLYATRPDKEWGLTDCASFIVMSQRTLTQALTADGYFQQYGFHALLLESVA